MDYPLEEVEVHINYLRNYIDDCETCSQPSHYLDKVERTIELKGDLTPEQKAKLLQVADECPILKTMNQATVVETSVV